LTISGIPNTASATPYAYTVTTTGGNCGSPSLTGSIKVISAPVLSTPTSYQVCDDNTDGVSCLFVLNTKDSEVTTTPGLTITYHLTPSDGQTGNNPIPKNTPYCNINNPQDIYVHVIDPNAPACYSTTTFQLIVNPKPLVVTVPNYQLCDTNSPGDGIEQFNLPTKDAQIINGQSSMVVSYYLTQSNATNQVNPLPSLYTSNTKTIWYNIKNTVTGCTSVGSLNLVVNPLPVITVNSPTVCQGAVATLTATPAVTGTYSYLWTVPSGVPNPGNVASFTTTVAGAYSVVATNVVTGCVGASASGTVTHITAPTISTPTDYVVCDDNADGVSCLFVLSTKDAQISTQPGIQITYHLTLSDSQTGSNPIPKNTPYCNIVNPQTIFVRVFNPAAPACSSYTTFQLIVNPKPMAHAPNDYHLCDTNPSSSVTEATFNLTGVVTPQILGSQSAANFTVTYYTTLANAQAPTNAITGASAYLSGTKTLWVRIQNNTTGCFDIITVNLVVDPLPTALAFYPQYELCETVAPVGVETFNLSSQVTTILQGQTGMQVTFYPTLAQAQSGLGAITNPSNYNNAAPYAQTVGIRITNTATGCYVISTIDLVVNPKPVPIPPTAPYTLCDNDQDGITCFNLNTLTPGISFQTPGVYTITYHLTQADATNNLNVLNAANYCNVNPFVQFLWVRAENPTTHCFAIMPIELNVRVAPNLPNPALAPIVNCDADSNPQDGCTAFDLTQQTSIIIAAQPLVTATYTVTYYTSQSDASASPSGLFPIIQTNNYISCVPTKTIWYRVENIASHCFIVGSFQIKVSTPIVLTTPTLMSLCDSDSQPNDLHTTFNMSGFVGTVPGHTLQFYLDPGHTQLIPNPGAFVNTIPGTQTVYIAATNNVTGCKSYRTLTIVVLPIPTPRTNLSNMPLVSCDTNNPNDGYEIFNLTTNAAYIANGDPNVTLHYYPSYTDAVNNTLEFIPATAANVHQNVWIRVESIYNIDYHGEHCYVLVEQPIKVNPLPLITPGVVYQECDDDTDGFTVFNLNSQAANLLSTNPLPLSNYTLAFYLNSTLTQPINNPNAFTNTNTTGNTQVIYVVATNTTTGCKSPVSQFTIMVNPKPTLTPPANYATCDTEPNDNDGYYLYPLDVLIPGILGTQLPADYTVSFYNTQADATNAVNAFTDLPNYQAHTQTVWIRVENNVTHCARIGSFNIAIEQEPQPLITAETNVICVDFNTHQVVRDLVLTATNTTAYVPGVAIPTYTYQWFDATGVAIPGATGSTLLVNQTFADNISTHFSVVMTSTSALGCSGTSPDFTVLQSGQAVPMPVGSSGYTITNAFSDNQTITVTVDGYGTYLYSLDDGPRQASNVFENVPLGAHYVTVWDSEGGVATSCDPLILTGVQIIDYPHYFTPNGDGINDTWNVVGLQNQPMAKIYIFDRYGKLIKEISPQSPGWDGTYNGNLMPSTDYWFRVDYSEANALKEFKAHFSLKR
jgi:gliding motility-associated-like protein